MNCRANNLLRRFLYAVYLWAFAAAAPRLWAQFTEVESGPEALQWSMVVPKLRYLETDVEAERTSDQSPGRNGTLNGERWFVSPRLGLEWRNYLYHPDLLNYSLLFEPTYVWQTRTLGGQTLNTSEVDLNGTYTANLLQAKPYASTASYSRSRDEVKYDFFNTATVDSQTWGGSSGYREGPVPVAVSYQQTHEDSSDFNQDTITDQKTLNLEAHNERARDNLTQLSYQFNEFDRETLLPGSSYNSDDTYQLVSLLDTEHFDSSVLRSTFRFEDRQTQGLDSTDLNAAFNYNLTHTPNLHSYYDYSFSRFTSDNSDSIQNYADAGIQHQLYDSLFSSLEAHGSIVDSSSGPSTLDTLSGGTTASFDYTKRLDGWGRLNLDNSTSYSWTEQDQSGTQDFIANESHTVPVTGLVRLALPREVSVTSVTDSKFAPLQPDLDYTVVQATDPWQIQILSEGPAHIQPGAVILVSYTVESNPSGNFSVFGNQTQIRFSFWQDMAAVFGRYALTHNDASSPQFLLQDDQTVQAGAEFSWSGLRLYGDYTVDHSTLYDSDSVNFTESYSLSLASSQSLGIDLNQQWSDNSFHTGGSTNLNEHMTYYDFTVHYDWHPTAVLAWNAEIGYRRQDGLGLTEDLFAARTYLRYRIGKLQFNLGYEHELQNIISTKRDRDYGYLRVRREF